MRGRLIAATVTHKLVHQLTSTRDPEFDLKVPASRIVGGYTVQDGVIVPNYSHAQDPGGRLLAHARSGRCHDRCQVVVIDRADHSLPARAVSRRRGAAGHAAPRAGAADEGRRRASAGRHLGGRRSRLFAGIRRGPAFRFLCRTGEGQEARSLPAKGMQLGPGPHRIPKEAEALAMEYLTLSVAPDDRAQ